MLTYEQLQKKLYGLNSYHRQQTPIPGMRVFQSHVKMLLVFSRKALKCPTVFVCSLKKREN